MATQLPSLSFGLEGKRVVITGAGGSIGSVLVSTFKAAGAVVIACDSDPALLDALPADHVSERHIFDLTSRSSIQAATNAIENADIVVNNAGWTRAEVFSQVTDQVVDLELQLNLTGVVDFTRMMIPKMVQKGSGNIIFISSVNALTHCGNPIYSIAKAGQVAFAKGIAVEYGTQGIRANTICPGSVHTAAWEHRKAANPKIFEDLVRFYPQNRIVTAQDLANTAVFLASPLSGGITGQAIAVDAGLTAGNRRLIEDIIAGPQ